MNIDETVQNDEELESYSKDIDKYAQLFDLSLAETEKFPPAVAAEVLFNRATNYEAACNILRASEALCNEKVPYILHACNFILRSAGNLILLQHGDNTIKRGEHLQELRQAVSGARDAINQNDLQTQEDIRAAFDLSENYLKTEGLIRVSICAGMWRAALVMVMNESTSSLPRSLMRDELRLLYNVATALENEN